MKFLILFLGFLGYNILLSAQTMEEKYSLDFRDYSWIKKTTLTYCYIDSSQTVDSKYPIKISSFEKTEPIDSKKDTIVRLRRNNGQFDKRTRLEKKIPFNFELLQDIVLPNYPNKKEIKLILNSKCENLQNIYLRAFCFDADENIVSCDSIYINKNYWGKDTLSFFAENTKMITISIIGNNDFNSNIKEQIFWGDKINIIIDGQNFNNYTQTNITKELLNKRHLYPLTSKPLKEIKELSNKKIISIGSSIDGNDKINHAAFVIIKELIENKRCKAVLLNAEMDICLKWDLYTQGIAEKNRLPEICRELKYVLRTDEYYAYRDFLVWLRKYNETQTDKIRIFGIEMPIGTLSHLLDYFNILQDKNSYPYSNIRQSKWNSPSLIDTLNNNPDFKTQMGENEWNYVMYIANEVINSTTLGYDPYLIRSINNRGIKMMEISDTITSLFLEKDTPFAIFANSFDVAKMHSKRKNELTTNPFGSYLHDKYKDQYTNISVQTNNNELTDNNSVERFFLNSNNGFFYYPSYALPADICTMRIIYKWQKNMKQFQFFNLKKRFDGFIFIN